MVSAKTYHVDLPVSIVPPALAHRQELLLVEDLALFGCPVGIQNVTRKSTTSIQNWLCKSVTMVRYAHLHTPLYVFFASHYFGLFPLAFSESWFHHARSRYRQAVGHSRAQTRSGNYHNIPGTSDHQKNTRWFAISQGPLHELVNRMVMNTFCPKPSGRISISVRIWGYK